jgi:hypothetical protein
MTDTYEEISKEIDTVIKNNFNVHPFSFGVEKGNIEAVLSQYFAMSQAFPYLQAGSQRNIILNTMKNNEDINTMFELTSVVGNFLCWDETGGHAIVRKHGNKGLKNILDTKNTFHANMLRKDIKKLTGNNINPNYSKITRGYLIDLLTGLESLDHTTRCAYMVAFENHAGIMIDSLWGSLVKLYDIDKDSLIYFKAHVGGAEPYHIEMTERMVSEIVTDTEIFLYQFKQAYSLNFNWCQSVKEA